MFAVPLFMILSFELLFIVQFCLGFRHITMKAVDNLEYVWITYKAILTKAEGFN